MKLNSDSVLSFGFLGLGLVAIGYAIGVHCKMKAVCEKLDTSIEKIASDAEIEIPQKIIDHAVERAVDREAASAVRRATDAVVDHVKRDISDQVTSAVESEYKTLSESVTAQIAKSVAKIDESRLKKEVIQKAKEQIAEKFDDKLDAVLEEFNGNLQNVTRIYKSMAKTLTKEDIIL